MPANIVAQSKPQLRPEQLPGNRLFMRILLLGSIVGSFLMVRSLRTQMHPKLALPEALKDCYGLWLGDQWLLKVTDDGKLATGFSIPIWSNLFDYQVTEYTADEIVIDGLLMQKRYHLDVMPHITPDRHLEMTVDGVVLRRIQ